MEGNYINDLKNGNWTYSFVNGALDMKGAFKEDKQNGFWTFYYPKGIEYYKGNFNNGQKEGKWNFFHYYRKNHRHRKPRSNRLHAEG